jgi:hypothetical protein
LLGIELRNNVHNSKSLLRPDVGSWRLLAARLLKSQLLLLA